MNIFDDLFVADAVVGKYMPPTREIKSVGFSKNNMADYINELGNDCGWNIRKMADTSGLHRSSIFKNTKRLFPEKINKVNKAKTKFETNRAGEKHNWDRLAMMKELGISKTTLDQRMIRCFPERCKCKYSDWNL